MSVLSRRFIAFVVVLLFPSVSFAGQATAAPKKASAVATRPAATKGMDNADIIKLAKSGLSDELIIASVRKSEKTAFDTSVDGLVALKAAGLSDAVISVMMDPKAPIEAPVPAPPVAAESKPATNFAVGEVVVPDGVEVRLRLLERVSSANAKVDETVRFEVVENVMVNDRVVIAQGAKGTGRVTEAVRKKSFGRSGKVNFTIDVVKAVDGQNIRLRGSKELKGDESFVKAGVVTYLTGPFGALVKGKDVTVDAGTEYVIYIDGDRRITLDSAQR